LLTAGRAQALERDALQAQIERLLHACDLWASRNARIRSLAPAQQRMVALTSALVANPPIILLDEPTAGLEEPDARSVLSAVRRILNDTTSVLATSHAAIACDLGERIAVLHKGRLIGERPRQDLLELFQEERYSIRVKGHLGPSWSEWFDGLTVVNEEGGAARITGRIPDQAALHGVLARIHALNLPLLDVRRAAPSLDEIVVQLYENA
jgi:ABC-2 type transport system ATP-binding protein